MKKSDGQIMEIQEAFNATGVARSSVLPPGRPRRRETADRAGQAKENADYLRELLSKRQPEFLAMLCSAERQVDLELSQLSRESRDPSRAAAGSKER